MVENPLSESTNTQNELVEQVYRHTNLVATYSGMRLFPPEATAFIRYRDDLVQRRVLDLGCGAGRLAIYIQHLTAAYTGFDISPYMVTHCEQAFPAAKFVEGDMRDLSVFRNGEFDTVLAVSNLFDAVSHVDRLLVLSEVHRVLVPSGLLFFSAHNRNFAGLGSGPQLEWHRNPVTQLRLLVDYSTASLRHQRLKSQQRFESDYALVNDSGNNFATLHYYIRRDTQLKQLSDAGFEPLECYDSLGRTLTADADDSTSPSIHYVARKTGH